MRTVNEITDPAQLLDFAQSKRLLQFSSGQALGDTTALLTRPNGERGSVEMGMIEAGHKRMGKLIDLHNAMPEVVRRPNDGATKLDVMREIKVGIMRERLTSYGWARFRSTRSTFRTAFTWPPTPWPASTGAWRRWASASSSTTSASGARWPRRAGCGWCA